MDERIPKIIDFLKLLDEQQINYAVGGSFLLMLHDITDDFYDVDILLDIRDYHKAFSIFRKCPNRIIPKTNPLYQTHTLVKVDYHHVQFDLIFDFKISKEQFDYHFPMIQSNGLELITYHGFDFNASLLEEWYLIYQLIERDEKVKLLERHFKKNMKESSDYMKQILSLRNLPVGIKLHMQHYLKDYKL